MGTDRYLGAISGQKAQANQTLLFENQ